MKAQRKAFLYATLAVLFVGACFLPACGTSKSSLDSSSGDGTGNGDPFGQSPVTTGDNGTGTNSPLNNPGLPPGSTTESPSIGGNAQTGPNDLIPGQTDPLSVYPGFDFNTPLLDVQALLSKIHPIQATDLPDPSFIQQLYCSVVQKYGPGYSNAYNFVLAVNLDDRGLLLDANGAAEAMRALANADSQTQRRNYAMSVLRTTEYGRLMTAGFYQTFLGRAASEPELSAGAQVFTSGQPEENLMISILTGSEYFRLRGGTRGTMSIRVQNFIRGLYRNVLGRNARNPEVRAWYRVYVRNGQGIAGRTAVAQGIVNSDEAFLKFRAFVDVMFLHRGPTAAENQQTIAEKNGGKRRLDFVADVQGSDEYYQLTRNRFGDYTQDGQCQ